MDQFLSKSVDGFQISEILVIFWGEKSVCARFLNHPIISFVYKNKIKFNRHHFLTNVFLSKIEGKY